MEKLKSGEGNHLTKSQGKSGAQLAPRGLSVQGPWGRPQECHPQRCPAQAQAVGVGGVEPHQKPAMTTAVSPLSREPPAAVGGLGAQPVGAVSFPPTAPPWRGRGRGRAAWLQRELVDRGDNSRHAVWAQPGDPWRGG